MAEKKSISIYSVKMRKYAIFWEGALCKRLRNVLRKFS